MGTQVLFHVLLGVRGRESRVGRRGDRVHGDIRRVRRGQRVHRVGRATVPRDAHRHQLFPAQPDRGRSHVRRHHARPRLRASNARLAVRPLCLPPAALLTVRVRFRAAVDADADQHGPAPVHSGAAVPVAVDAAPSRRADRADVDDRARRVPARAVLVPRADRATGPRPGGRVHAGVPQERHVQAVHRVHGDRRLAVLRAAPHAVRLPLPADIPQAEQDAPAHRALRLAPGPGRVAQQPVAARQRRWSHAAGAGASRGAQVPEARARGARAADQRDRGAGDVAADHGGDVPDLRGRQPGHGGHGLLPAVAPLHHGAAVRAAQHRRQPHPVRRAVRELPQVLRPPVVHIEAPARHEPRTAGQHEQGRRPDAQQRPLQLDAAARQFRVRGRAARGRGRVLVGHQRVLVTADAAAAVTGRVGALALTNRPSSLPILTVTAPLPLHCDYYYSTVAKTTKPNLAVKVFHEHTL